MIKISYRWKNGEHSYFDNGEYVYFSQNNITRSTFNGMIKLKI